MPRFKKPIKGPDAKTVEDRLVTAVSKTDEARAAAHELSARLERARGSSMERERSRVAHKHGAKSPQARRVEAAMHAQQGVAARALAAAQRARTPIPKVDPKTIVVHGRAVDDQRLGVGGLQVVLIDPRQQPLARAKTDDNGYFKLELRAETPGREGPGREAPGREAPGREATERETPGGEPTIREAVITTPAGTRAVPPAAAARPPGRRAATIVISRGDDELAREAVEDLGPGETRYREVKVRVQR